MIARSPIDIVMLADFGEGYALRSALEEWGYRVNVFPIGRPRHVVEVLGGGISTAPHVVISCHGGEEGICLPELAPEIAKDEPFLNVLTPQTLAGFVHLPGRIVVSTTAGPT